MPIKLTSALEAALRRVAPITYSRRRVKRMQLSYVEPELKLLPKLIECGSSFVDVGAASGLYTFHAVKHATHVHAFEPRYREQKSIEFMARTLQLPVTCYPEALSNVNDTATLRRVKEAGGLSTIESYNPLSYTLAPTVESSQVNCRRLDSYELCGISLIKIDVEGHEHSVLEGAELTIQQNRPVILLESEERNHKGAITQLRKYISNSSYKGFFILNNHLEDIDVFDVPTHQDPVNIGDWRSNWRKDGMYINNFILIPQERMNSDTRIIPDLNTLLAEEK